MNVHSPDLGSYLEPLLCAKDSRYPDLREVSAAPKPRTPQQGPPPYWSKGHQEERQQWRMEIIRKICEAIKAGHDGLISCGRYCGMPDSTMLDHLRRALRMGYISRLPSKKYCVLKEVE